MKSKLTIEVLRSELLYDQETGSIKRRASGKEVYKELRRGGYRITVAGENIMAHRAIWAIVHGEFTVPKNIRFVDGDPRNLQLKNISVPNLQVEKLCPACNSIKPLDTFHRNSTRATARGSYCKECVKGQRALEHRKQKVKEKRINSYNISVTEYQAMEQTQEGKCKICKIPAEEVRYKTLVIDHDHKTEKVRGLLCPACNAAIGLLKDDPLILLNAAKYLLGKA